MARRRKEVEELLEEVHYILVQLSGFTIHGSETPLEEMDAGSRHLRQFTIPSSQKPHLREQLDHLGIGRSSLFPDLANLATDLAREMEL